jgi:transposase
VIPDAVQVFVAIEPVDLRSGFDRLAGFARERIGLEPSASALFVFFGRRRDAVKIVFLDRTGRCLFHKRLHRGTFAQLTALAPNEHHIELDAAALDELLDGIAIQPQATKQKRTIH